ncbi:MAG: DUF4340 domain-containing protein [Opitutaceae bacterium]|nr:DUF4340 domain-containing protein [Opitutaceae bacterium]
MRTKVTLVLLFLNVALFFFIFKFERGWRTEQATLEARRRVLGPETADIRSLRITGPNLTPVALARQGDTWSLTTPIEWPANPHAVSRILNELQFLEHETSFSVADLEKNNQSLADYGLDQPRLTLTFTSGAGDQSATATTLQIGDETKVGNRIYILSPDGKRVHVVGLSLARSLNLPLDELRADNVFSIPVFEARSLNLQNPANLRVRIRREGNRWAFEAPVIARANKVAVELAINALNALRVCAFTPADAAPDSAANSTGLRITLEGNNRRETLILGSEIAPAAAGGDSAPATRPDPEFNATLEGKATAFTVSLPAALIDTLRNAQETLRETRILDFDSGVLSSVTLAAPNQPELTLQQIETGTTGAGWQTVRRNGDQGPQTNPAEPRAVQTLVEHLRGLTAQRFVSDAPSDADLESWGFNRPEREITLRFGAGADAVGTKLQIGLPTTRDGHAYARLENARSVFLVAETIVAQTAPDPLVYRQRVLRELPETAKISALTITDLRAGNVVWQGPLDQPSPAVNAVLAGLRRIEAQSFVQEGFPDSVYVGGADRHWRWRVDATVLLPAGNGEQTEQLSLWLTDRTGGDQQLAGSKELAVVFTVPQAFLDAFWQLSYGDKDPGLPADEAKATATPPPSR